MQTFLPYPYFQKSAMVLDNKRLGKQRVECLQILRVLSIGPIQNSINPCQGFKYNNGLYQRKTPWYNHPAVQMWKGYEGALAIYTRAICYEWIGRGFKDTILNKLHQFPTFVGTVPDWLGNEAFHASHRSNLLRKDPKYYSRFGWTEPHDLPYVWPTKQTHNKHYVKRSQTIHHVRGPSSRLCCNHCERIIPRVRSSFTHLHWSYGW